LSQKEADDKAERAEKTFNKQPSQLLIKSTSSALLEYKQKSLYYDLRKREMDRIERENQKIAERIFSL